MPALGTSPRWRRSLVTFALGAALGAGLFPTGQAPSENRAEAATRALDAPAARSIRVEPTSCATAPAAAAFGTIPSDGAVDQNCAFDAKLAATALSRGGDPRCWGQVDPVTEDLGAQAEKRASTRSSAETTSARTSRASSAGSRRRPLNFQTSSIQIVQDLELDPTVVPFRPMILSRPDFVAYASGVNSANFPPPPR
jgi:hypothetical protein